MSVTEHKRNRREREHSGHENQLLRRISPPEYGKLAAEVEAVTLSFKEPIFEQGKRISHVYFPTTCVISLITVLADGSEPVETATIGREGFVGLPVFLEALHAPWRALCQIPGTALRMSADRLVAVVEGIDTLHTLLLRYTNQLLTVMSRSAACNRAHDTKARMARWLLTTHDRVDRDEFPLTQEFLGQMLGVRRPAVSLAGTALQQEGLIKYTRGKITVIDRPGLEAAGCECYGHIRREYAKQFGD